MLFFKEEWFLQCHKKNSDENYTPIEETMKLFEVKSVETHEIFCRITISRHITPFQQGRHPTDIPNLSICFLTSPDISMILHWWSYGALHGGPWFWSETRLLWIMPTEKIQSGSNPEIAGTTDWGHIDQSTFLWISHWGIQCHMSKYVVVPHLDERDINLVPMPKHSCQDTQHLSLHSHGRWMVRSLLRWLMSNTFSVAGNPCHVPWYHEYSDIRKCDNYDG
jgi:hypothetical protein